LKARGGGSVPARERWQIDDLVRGGGAQALHGYTVEGVRRRRGRWHVDVERHGSCRSYSVDHVVAATGSRAHVRRDALLRPLSQEAGTRHCQGFPVLSPDLRPTQWPVHVMGALALSEVGPAARTIIGARIASERLLPAIAGVQTRRRQYPHPAGE
jgi:hypothetical protein